MKAFRHLVIHHSAGPREQTTEQIRAYHKAPKPRGNGWADIGYHHVIEADGRLHVGRPLPATGAHVGGLNSESVGVCVVGDNTREGMGWSKAQLAALARYVAAWKLLVPGIEVIGHGQAPRQHTACPGVGPNVLAAMVRGDSLIQGG